MPETHGKPAPPDGLGRPDLHGLPRPTSVDLRILQANERTFLSWIRTGLSLMAFGFVVARIGIWMQGAQPTQTTDPSLGWTGSAFVALGTVSQALATARYLRIRRALLQDQAVLPGNALIFTLALGLILLGGVLIAFLVSR